MPSNPGLYDAIIPTGISQLKGLKEIITKAEEHCKASDISFDDTIVPARLAPDMLPLSFQIYIATDLALKIVSRFKDESVPPVGFPADYNTLFATAALIHARIDEAIAVLESCTPEEFKKGEHEEMQWSPRPQIDIRGPKRDYLLAVVVPNMAFHVTTAYSILRNRGVQIGKFDILKPFFDTFLPDVNFAGADVRSRPEEYKNKE